MHYEAELKLLVWDVIRLGIESRNNGRTGHAGLQTEESHYTSYSGKNDKKRQIMHEKFV